MDFKTKLAAAMKENHSLLCIGLDPVPDRLPAHIRDQKESLFHFNQMIIDATADLVCAYKPNSAFYEAGGAQGIKDLKSTCDYLKQKHPTIPIILDFKRGDIGNTNRAYAEFAFDYLGADAVTLQPYQGREAIQPFLDYKGKGIIILCRTSNPGAGEFQDIDSHGEKLFEIVATKVRDEWNENHNCLLVVGATYPNEMVKLRHLMGDMPFLVPGAGSQGGDIAATVKAGVTADKTGLIINSSREIIYASSGDDCAEAASTTARRLRDLINSFR